MPPNFEAAVGNLCHYRELHAVTKKHQKEQLA